MRRHDVGGELAHRSSDLVEAELLTAVTGRRVADRNPGCRLRIAVRLRCT